LSLLDVAEPFLLEEAALRVTLLGEGVGGHLSVGQPRKCCTEDALDYAIRYSIGAMVWAAHGPLHGLGLFFWASINILACHNLFAKVIL